MKNPTGSTTDKAISFHKYANLFPMLEGAQKDELTADIAANGILEPIVMIGDEILDGRNRFMCAKKAGVAIKSVQFSGDDPLAFVISVNLHRRHMTTAQRALLAARLAKLPKGANQHTPNGGPSQKQVSEMLSVSPRSIDRAKTIISDGAPGLDDAVAQDEISIPKAVDIASMPIKEQVALIKRADPKAYNAASKDVRDAKTLAKKKRRHEREAELAENITALPDKKYGVILQDPEWRFEPFSRETGMDRAPENHYPTSHVDDIKARPVESIAADDCVLFLWATAPMLQQALDVVAAHGFEYKTHIVWNKVRSGKARGPGYWFTGEHELCLVGTRGKAVAPAPGEQFPSSFDAPVGKHSEKPSRVHEIIESYFPNIPKIELNARKAREGWDVWGNEADNSSDTTPKKQTKGTKENDGPKRNIAKGNSKASGKTGG